MKLKEGAKQEEEQCAVGCGVVVRRIFGLDFVMMLSRHGRVC